MDTSIGNKGVNCAGLSPVDKIKIRTAFANMDKGDVIDGKDFRLVVIRRVENGGVVIAQSCESGKRLIQVFDNTFTWSDEHFAIVDPDGNVPEWWNFDLQMRRDECVKFAEKYAHIPISAEYPPPSEEMLTELKLLPTSEVLKAAEILHYGGGLAAMVLSAKMLGVSLTPLEAAKLEALRNAVNTISKTREIILMLGIPSTSSPEEGAGKGDGITRH